MRNLSWPSLARAIRLRCFTVLGFFSVLCGTILPMSGSAQEVCKDPRKIVGGEDADLKNYPWQVALDVDGALCGGTIIHRDWVLTAAHCFQVSKDPRSIRAKAGVSNYEVAGRWIAVDRVIVHGDYNPDTNEHDLALVKLKSQPIGKPIPPARPELKLEPCALLEVSGWGRTKEGGRTSKTLQRALVPYVDNATCNAPGSYDGAIRPNMMCAGLHAGGIDACQGDSGGPLVLRSEEHGVVLVGVVSWGIGCAHELKYGVYTRVTPYREWISKVVTSDGK